MNLLQEVTQQSNGQCTGRSPLSQAWLDGLNHAASALIKSGVPPSELDSLMAEHIRQVEENTGERVQFQHEGSGIRFIFDSQTRLDQIRIENPREVRLLSARIGAATISANLSKAGKYHHGNARLAESFRRLAFLIEQAPAELADRNFYFSCGSWR